jgi:sugar lactone lactonase YvrE
MNPPSYRLRPHKLRDVKLEGWREKIVGRWHYRDLVADPSWFHGWISFDSLCWDEQRGVLFCGLNSLDGDLLYRFDPRTGAFASCGTQWWADAFDSKIHRCLLKNPLDGNLYFGTSLLHDADQQHEAPGGKLVRYDPDADAYDVLGIPEPHLYLQSIAADWQRGILYAFTYPAEFLVRFDLRTRTSRRLAYVGNAISFAQPHNAVVDASGKLWGTYAETRAWDEVPSKHPIRLFNYDPDADRFTWFAHGLSRRDEREQRIPDPPQRYAVPAEATETRHKDDYGFCDGMVYDGGRYIYAGTVAGVLCRIDTTDGAVQKIAHVMPSGRLPAMAIHDGVLYAAGGVKGQTQAIRWPIGSKTIEDLGDLVDPNTGERPARIHELAVDDRGKIYLAENDHHGRSSYLWTLEPAADG